MLLEGGAVSWVAKHRMDRRLSDRPQQDLHTRKDGFWRSHTQDGEHGT